MHANNSSFNSMWLRFSSRVHISNSIVSSFIVYSNKLQPHTTHPWFQTWTNCWGCDSNVNYCIRFHFLFPPEFNCFSITVNGKSLPIESHFPTNKWSSYSDTACQLRNMQHTNIVGVKVWHSHGTRWKNKRKNNELCAASRFCSSPRGTIKLKNKQNNSIKWNNEDYKN